LGVVGRVPDLLGRGSHGRRRHDGDRRAAKVSHPGIDNTIEAILMAAIAAVQVLLFALGAAGVRALGMFNNTEFLLLTLISMTQAVIGILINARTMRRSIDIVPGE
jgi:hypothetical protein